MRALVVERGAAAAAGDGAAAPEVCRCRVKAGAMRLHPRQKAIEPRRHWACGAVRPTDGVPGYLDDDDGGMADGESHEVSHRNVAPGPAQSAALGGTRLVMRVMPPHSGQAGASLRSGKLPLSMHAAAEGSASRSARQSASFVARWRLARKPMWRMRWKPSGWVCRRKRRMNS